MKYIVITGASGFHGSNIVDHLRITKQRVIGFSRKSGYNVERRIQSYYELGTIEKFGLSYKECCLIHLADNPDASIYSLDKEISFESKKLANYLSKFPWKRSIYASSATVYKANKYGELISEKSTEISKSQYAQTKIECEKNFLRHGGHILRLTNLIGNGMNKNTIIGDILDHFTSSKRPNNDLYLRDASSLLDLLAIEDAARAFKKIIFQQSNHPEIFNIGSGKSIVAYDLAKLIMDKIRITEVTVKSKNAEKESGIILDIEKAKKTIMWEPKISLSVSISNILRGNLK